MAKIDISIVYVNYNTQDLLEASMQSLKDLKGVTYKVIVVDNASKQFDAAALKIIIPDITIIKSKTNLGFGKANNLAAQRATGDYLWLLNTDTLVEQKDSLERLVSFIDAHSNYAAVVPLLANEDGTSQQGQIAYLPSISRIALEKIANAIGKVYKKPSKILKGLKLESGGYSEQDVEQAVAAALLIRRSVFEGIGGFSPEYFMYYEDTDLCKKLQSAGQKIRFLPSAKVTHLQGKSISQDAKRKHYYYDSQDMYFSKWKSGISHFFLKLLRLPSKLYYKIER